MAKVIIQPKLHLPDESFKLFVKMINDQLNNDIVYVPYYCDVYVLDNADIEVQKDEKKECDRDKYYPFFQGSHMKKEVKDE